MKTLGVITLFLLAIIISVGVSVYIIRQKQPKKTSQRYQLVFGEILHGSVEPSDEPGISSVLNKTEPICFKFDTKKGTTWRYVSSFYQDPNILATTLGFELVPSDDRIPFTIVDVVERKKPQNRFARLAALDKEAKIQKTLEDLRSKIPIDFNDLARPTRKEYSR